MEVPKRASVVAAAPVAVRCNRGAVPLVWGVFLIVMLQLASFGATLSDPEVDHYNVRISTQTFSGLYHFTTNTLLVETADAIHELGTETIKLYLASNFQGKYGITLGPDITNLVTLVRDEPSCRHVMDMPFRNYVAWIYPFAYWWPFDGYSASERSSEYKEVYDLTRYFLTNYNNSGKTFYLGHWEGDGYLTGGVWTTNPTPTMIQGFIDCLNNRQKAVDDAKAATSFTNVNVFCYAEANRVRDAMLNGTNSNLRMINAVVPYVTNLDYLSYSSYDAQNLSAADLYTTLDYMEAHLPTNKVTAINGERIWIGEYGFANAGTTPDQQEPLTRAYIQRLLNYGRKSIPHILFWEIYNNEPGRYFCLIDSNNVKVASWYLHERFINNSKLACARFKETHARLPTDSEFVSLVSPMLNQPIPAPVGLGVSNLSATLLSGDSAQLAGSFAQGIYGADEAAMRLYWGRQDGGTNRSAWEQMRSFGVNTNFNPIPLSALLTNLVPNTNYFFRFYGSNSTGEAWAPASSQISTVTLNPSAFAYRMRVRFAGYDRGESLLNFPCLIQLGTNLPGFHYQQFASASGGDLRITDSGGLVPIAFEIDEWNTNGLSSVWARVPLVSGTNDFVWAYWGNPAATVLPPSSTNGAVWSADHFLVWHLKESGFPFADSALQYPALSGAAPFSTPGFIGRGVALNGSSQYLNAGVVPLGDAFTISAWVKLDPSSTNIQAIWVNKPGGWNSPGFGLYVNSYNTADHELRLETGDGTDGSAAATVPNVVTSGQWHQLAATIDRLGGTALLFVDGVDRTASSSVTSTFENQATVQLGRFTNSSFYLKGTVDEARIENGIRSANWVWANWLNQASNANLLSYSAINPQPRLSWIVSAGQIRLGWPVDAGVFSLASATNLTPPVAWEPVPGQAELNSNQWQVLLPASPGENRFYRLQQ